MKGCWWGKRGRYAGGMYEKGEVWGYFAAGRKKNALWRESKTLSRVEGGPRPRPLKTSYRLSRAYMGLEMIVDSCLPYLPKEL